MEAVEPKHTNIKGACKYLGVSRPTLLKWMYEQGMAYSKVGRRYFIKYSSMDEFLDRHSPNEDIAALLNE